MSHVFLLERHGRAPHPMLETARRHRALLVAAALTAAAASFGSYSLEHRGAPPPTSSCVTAVGALGTYGVANGLGVTSTTPACSAG